MSNELDVFLENNTNDSRETIEKLAVFRSFLIEKNQQFNLVSKNEISKIWIRHIQDSLRLLSLLEQKKDTLTTVLDIGSGGGFPAIPIAIALRNQNYHFTLCESIRKKSNFLSMSSDLLELTNTKIINSRVEDIINISFDVITCRAVAKLSNIFTYTHHLLKQNSVFLLHKGIKVEEEIINANKQWFFEHELIENKLEEGSFILKVKNLKKHNKIK